MLKPPVKPMLLSEITKPFNSENYLFEIKWDGYRAIAFINDKELYLQSRNQQNITPYFPEINNISQQLKCSKAVLDGELCYLDAQGKPIFSKLQGRLANNPKGQREKNIKYIVWDLLSLNGKDIYHYPLQERKRLLNEQIKDKGILIISSYVENEGIKLYEAIKKEGLEGMVAKKKDSPYEFKRSKYWYKIKVWKYTDTIIVGYSGNQEALLVGKMINSQLKFMGKVKIALPKDERQALFRYLPQLEIRAAPPIKNKYKDIIWVQPLIKCQVRYTEITKHHSFRHGFVDKLIY